MDYLCGQWGTMLVDKCVCVCAPVMSGESSTETVAVK